MMPTAIRRDLSAAASSAELVRILRTIRGAGRIDGFVLKIGAKWLLVQNLDPGMFLDGHIALRVRDIRSVRPSPSASFAARALKHYGDKARMPGRVDLTSTRTLIESASRRFPLVTIHV